VSKLERLMNLTALLLDTEYPVPASGIQLEVPGYPEGQTSFRRAFERDKDDLREMGIPITVEVTPGTDPPIDGYRIHKHDYYLADPGLEPDELAAIHLAATAVRFEGGSSAEAIWKLGGVEAEQSVAEELAAIPAPPHLSTLFGALSERRPVRFAYAGVDREVEPRRLDFLRGHWYLSGHDRTRGADRNFRLDRVQGSVRIGDPGGFERTAAVAPGARLEPWQLGDSEVTIATISIAADRAEQARRRLGAKSEVGVSAGGDSLFEVPVANVDGFRSFVLGFLDHAEVLGPPELRESVVEWLTAMATR
jgi:proteasome accessory factor B